MMQHNDKFAAKDQLRVRMALEKAPDSEFVRLSSMDLKSPTMTLVLALALGGYGVGAFYVKKIGFGIMQVAVFIIYMISAIAMSVISELAGNSDDLLGLVIFLLVVFFALTALMIILVIVSAIKARSWTQEYNINKFLETICY
jgi:ABC-type sugar transport system permease subunit